MHLFALKSRQRNMMEILELLWTFRSVQLRMILHDSLLTRQAGSVPSLQSLSRDAVLLILSTNNTQERLVTPLVDRLKDEIPKKTVQDVGLYHLLNDFLVDNRRHRPIDLH